MIADVIKIGNSKGIRLPSYILKECNISEKVEMEVKDGKIIIIPVISSREKQDTEFEYMNKNGEDKLLIAEGYDASSIILNLPKNVDIEELMYQLYVLKKVKKGQKEIEEGNFISIEELKKETQTW